jgi:hypothetical protein
MFMTVEMYIQIHEEALHRAMKAFRLATARVSEQINEKRVLA